MAKLALVYGLRLFPAEEIQAVGGGSVTLKNGKQGQITFHLLEGGREEIRRQLLSSIDAFFEFYPEI